MIMKGLIMMVRTALTFVTDLAMTLLKKLYTFVVGNCLQIFDAMKKAVVDLTKLGESIIFGFVNKLMRFINRVIFSGFYGEPISP